MKTLKQLKEISSKTLGSYIKGATNDVESSAGAEAAGGGGGERVLTKRKAGIGKAVDKLLKRTSDEEPEKPKISKNKRRISQYSHQFHTSQR